jgi:hypothetical protein
MLEKSYKYDSSTVLYHKHTRDESNQRPANQALDCQYFGELSPRLGACKVPLTDRQATPSLTSSLTEN